MLDERIGELERQNTEAERQLNAAEGAEGWLAAREEYELKKEAREYVKGITKAIRDNGGLRLEDFVRNLGEELAKELRQKWPGLFRNTTQGPQLQLDVLTQQLQAMGINLDVQGLVDWLQNTLNEEPKRPEASMAATPELLDELMFRGGAEAVRDYAAARRRYLEGQLRQNGDAAEIAGELRDLDRMNAKERLAALKERYEGRMDALREQKNARIKQEIQNRREALAALKAKQAERAKLRKEVDKMQKQIRAAAKDGKVIWHVHQEILARLGGEKMSQSLKEANVAALRELHREIMEMRDRGRRELEQKNLMKREAIVQAREKLRKPLERALAKQAKRTKPGAVAGREDTGKAYPGGIRGWVQGKWDWIKANTLGAQRFFDLLDGGRGEFDGAWIEFFVNQVNAAKDAELREVFRRREWMENRMEKLKLTPQDLARKVDTGVPKRGSGSTIWTMDEILSVYAGMQNERSREAILFGNFAEAGSEEAAMEWAGRLIQKLSPELKALGDAIIEEYDGNFDRINAAMIDIYNAGMEKQERYTPMRRLEFQGKGGIMDADSAEALMNAQVNAGAMPGVNRDFTKSRVEMRPENQTGIALGLYEIWHSQMETQEHAAAFGGLVRDMRRVLLGKTKEESGPTLRQMVTEAHGKEAWKNIQNYFTIVATDRGRIADDALNKASNWLARNMSKAYLCYNLGTCIKQTTSLYRVLPYTDFDCLMGAIGDWAGGIPEWAATRHNPFFDAPYETDPQLENRRGNALIAEMRQGEGVSGGYQKFLGIGMDLIGKFDRATSAIVWKAVYDTNIKRGLSPEAAARQAQRVVLLTQPASHAKDMPRLWNTAGGVARLSMMFTNDLAQTFGITVYDIGAMLRRGDMPAAFWTILSVTLAGVFMGLVTDGGPDEPDDPESWAAFVLKAFSRPAIEAWPLVGKGAWGLADTYLLGNKGAFFSSENPYLTPFAKIAEGVSGIVKPKKATDKGILNVIEGAALLSQFPATGIRRLWNAGKEGLNSGDPWRVLGRLIGTRMQEKKMRRRR